jgi:hypothetical protein
MSSTVQQPPARDQVAAPRPVEVPTSLWRDPAYQAFWTMRIGFTALPIAMGIDKFFNAMVYWPQYLASWLYGSAWSAQSFMYFVGSVECLAGVLCLLKPRYAAYIVAAWLVGIWVNLFSYPGWYDIGVRDFGLTLAALTLGRLAWKYDPPLGLELRLRSRLSGRP